MLEVKNISFKYSDASVLSAVSFTLEKGEHLAIMGESGSGKSTLLKAIFGELDITHGAITWKEKSLLGPNFNLIGGESFIKYVSQDFNLMPFTTVAENIAKHLSVFEPESHEMRINELLQLMGLEAYAFVKVKNLSGGQKQRIQIARLLLSSKPVVLLDEITSALDTRSTEHVISLLKEFCEGKTMIMITHDFDTLILADHVLEVKHGGVFRVETVMPYR